MDSVSKNLTKSPPQSCPVANAPVTQLYPLCDSTPTLGLAHRARPPTAGGCPRAPPTHCGHEEPLVTPAPLPSPRLPPTSHGEGADPTGWDWRNPPPPHCSPAAGCRWEEEARPPSPLCCLEAGHRTSQGPDERWVWRGSSRGLGPAAALHPRLGHSMKQHQSPAGTTAEDPPGGWIGEPQPRQGRQREAHARQALVHGAGVSSGTDQFFSEDSCRSVTAPTESSRLCNGHSQKVQEGGRICRKSV